MTFQEMPECDHLENRLRMICRGESTLGRELENVYRQRWGLPPLTTPKAAPAVEPAPPPAPKMPSFWVRGLHFAEALLSHTLNGFKYRSPAEIEARLDICRQCEFSIRENGSEGETVNCSKCGCQCNASNGIFLSKLAWASETCPDGRWT